MLSNLMISRFHERVFRFLMASSVIGCLLLPLSGCNQIPNTSIVQIVGEVRMDRKPLAGAMVAFISLEPRGANRKITELAFGKTNDVGRFELRTSEARGVPPGEYRVLIFRSNGQTDAAAQIDDNMTKVKPIISGLISDASLVLAAIGSFNSFAQTMEKQSTMGDIGGVPVTYNIQSTLRLTVSPGAGIIEPKFELDGHPQN